MGRNAISQQQQQHLIETSRDPVGAYARAVGGKRIVAGPLVRAACRRHLQDRRTGRARGLRFSLTHARRAIRFFERCLCLPDRPEPFALRPWQQFIVGSLFGWLTSDGSRRFRRAYIEIGKGNGKTPLAAGIGLYGLVADGEPAAEIYTAGVTREQAAYLFTDAVKMVNSSGVLRARLMVGAHNLAHLPSHSYMRPVSSEGRSLDQKRVHMALVDEIHEHRSGVVVDKMRAGTKGRRRALIVEITNSGHDRASVCWRHHEYGRRVLEGLVENDAWFAYICGLDEEDDLEDERMWLKPNPNLDVSVTRQYLREVLDEARGMPEQEGLVQRLNFCVWTQTLTRWLDMRAWAACPTTPEDDARRCFGGLDLGWSDDFAAFALFWPEPNPAVRVWLWLPGQALRKPSGRPYDAWLRTGALRVTEGDVTDFDAIRATIRDEIAPHYALQRIQYDPRNALQLALQLEGDGLAVHPVAQGFGLSSACRRLAALVTARTLAHPHNPVLDWMASNAVVRTGAHGDIRIDKDKAGDKVDGIAALVMAQDAAIREPEESATYDGLVSVDDGTFTPTHP